MSPVSDGDEEIVEAFLEESRENLDQLDRDLVSLETQPGDSALLARIFRTIHTIKGTCGFLGFRHLEALTHAGENLLGALRTGDLALDAAVTTSLLHLVDTVRQVLGRIEASGAEGEGDHQVVIDDLERHLVDAPSVTPEAPAPADGGEVVEVSGPAAESSIRVDVTVLDKLMDLVGELILARSQIGELVADEVEGALALPYRQLRLVSGELQEGVMRSRLQAVGTVTGKFRRVVRDLSAALGKSVVVEIEGEEVGVDKAVNEALRDPLLHLVRNAVDHGVELPTDRIAAGKSPDAHLRIRAFHKGGHVQVEVSDDGRGVDPEGLIRRAVSTGVITAEEGADLSERDALNLIFRPGLTTKDKVTNLSGRGVGMDVVRAGLEQVGGSIDVASEPGRGTVFRINVPLTLAIMPAVIVSSGGGRYAVPQVDVQEVIHFEVDEVEGAVEDIDGARMHRLRGRLLPLLSLEEQLGLQPIEGEGSAGLTIVVLESGGRRFGLAVDAVGDAIEAVVKPLTSATLSITAFAGVTILSDGRPSLILDVAGLATRAGIVSAGEVAVAVQDPGIDPAGAGLLIATGADRGKLAVPMGAVVRLEQFLPEAIERSGPLEVTQYRGGILPLVRVGDALAERRAEPRAELEVPSTDALQVVVCETSLGLVGLVVHRIEDVAAEPSVPPQPPSRRGVAASVVVDGWVTEILDVEALIVDAGLRRTA